MNPAAERADAPEVGGGIRRHEQHPGFVVIESKASGREVVVGRCDDEQTALSVLRLLSWAGAVARIERTE